ncbi:MAG: replicative DNA helicase [bacterium]|nr:replicative DNA helicase [bacterium]
MALKLPPQDIETERAVLGALMVDSGAIIKVADFLFPNDFYKPVHQKIYEVVLDLFTNSQPIDLLSVSTKLKENKSLEEIGGVNYLTDLINEVPTASHIAHYAKTVKEKKVLRDLIQTSAEINEKVYENIEVEDLLDEVEQKIFNITQHSLPQKYIKLKDELQAAYERIEKLHRGEEAIRGVPTGFTKLDDNLSGLQRSDFIILGARPSLGKTALALDIARHAAVKNKIPVGIFSLEMSREQVVDRLIAAEANVTLWRLRTGKLNDQLEFGMIQEALDRLSQAPIFIDDTPSPSILQIRSAARRMQLEQGLGLVIVDYLQLIQPRTNSDNMVQQVTEISRGLKALARELKTPVLALSQLSRAVDQREIKIPRLSDLRESGSLEQDADVVMLLCRKNWERNDASPEELNLTEVIISKHRNGPTGSVELMFDPDRVSFKNIDKTHQENSNF